MAESYMAALEASLLGQLPHQAVSDIRSSARIVELQAGKLLYEPPLSVILDGTVRTFIADGSGRQLTVAYLGPARALGLTGCAGVEYPLAHQAISATTLLTLTRSQVRHLRRDHPELGWATTEELARMLDDVLGETASVAFQPVRARVAHHLLALQEQRGDTGPGIHQADLAAAVGSVREVVGRSLNGLRDDGLVAVDRTGVTILDADGLRRAAALFN